MSNLIGPVDGSALNPRDQNHAKPVNRSKKVVARQKRKRETGTSSNATSIPPESKRKASASHPPVGKENQESLFIVPLPDQSTSQIETFIAALSDEKTRASLDENSLPESNRQLLYMTTDKTLLSISAQISGAYMQMTALNEQGDARQSRLESMEAFSKKADAYIRETYPKAYEVLREYTERVHSEQPIGHVGVFALAAMSILATVNAIVASNAIVYLAAALAGYVAAAVGAVAAVAGGWPHTYPGDE